METGRDDRAAPVRPGEELPRPALARYLAGVVPGAAGDLEVEQFPSGFSNLTYLVRYGGRELVLRRPPFGATVRSGHDMGREYRILSALAGRYGKAPAPVAFCDDLAVLGAPFYLMERVSGVILRPVMERPPAPAEMAAAAAGAIGTLVELHALDYAAAGLGDLGRPEGYVARQVEGWGRRWRAARVDAVPAMERLAAWLAERRPRESGAALVHNDFKYDNLVLDPRDFSRVRAVLDWEMSTLGDPLMDLGGSLAYWVEPSDPPAMRRLALSPTALPGNPGRAEVLERYAAASGRELRSPVFYYAFGLFKLAVIVQQIYARFRRGATDDVRFAGLGEAVAVCAASAERAIELGRIDRLYG